MDKLKMHSVNKVDENIKKIAELFPNTLTEAIKGYREDGTPIIEHAIDFDVLRQDVHDRRQHALVLQRRELGAAVRKGIGHVVVHRRVVRNALFARAD